MSRRRRGAGLAFLVALVLRPIPAYSETASERDVMVGVATDAWYATGVSGCASPIGCPPIAAPVPNTYPSDTLHVEATLGQESARSYLSLDLSLVPFDATVTGGTLTLPLSGAENAGTRAQETAALRACLVTAPFADDAEGSTAQPPPIDCQVKSDAKFSDETFTVDLGPLVHAWQAGKSRHGIALVPAPEAMPTAAWHLAFDGHNRSAQGVRPITGSLTFTTPEGESTLPLPFFTPTGPKEADLVLPEPPSSDAPSAAPVPQVAAPLPLAQGGRGFQYPASMLMPLLLLVGGLFLFRTFTQKATPPPAFEGDLGATGGSISRGRERGL